MKENEMGKACTVQQGAQNLVRRDHLEDLSLQWRIILKWIVEKENGRIWSGFI
jgi:hypothetical protein